MLEQVRTSDPVEHPLDLAVTAGAIQVHLDDDGRHLHFTHTHTRLRIPAKIPYLSLILRRAELQKMKQRHINFMRTEQERRSIDQLPIATDLRYSLGTKEGKN